MAARKAIVRRVRITSKAFPPPGATTSTSATSMTTPNFQANCIDAKTSRGRSVRGGWSAGGGAERRGAERRWGRSAGGGRSARGTASDEPRAAKPLLDRPRPGQRQDQRPQRHSVHHEDHG